MERLCWFIINVNAYAGGLIMSETAWRVIIANAFNLVPDY